MCVHMPVHANTLFCNRMHASPHSTLSYPQLSEFFGFRDAEEGQHPFFPV